jgi:hypothetical protein
MDGGGVRKAGRKRVFLKKDAKTFENRGPGCIHGALRARKFLGGFFSKRNRLLTSVAALPLSSFSRALVAGDALR